MNIVVLVQKNPFANPGAASSRLIGLLNGIAQLEIQQTGLARNFHEVMDYRKPNVSEKVVRIILSYTDYINRVVWSENN